MKSRICKIKYDWIGELRILLHLTGKAPGDDCKLTELKLKNNQKIMMMGTREEVITEVVNNFKTLLTILGNLLC